MISANQKYKTSGSKVPFKIWLNNEQEKGNLVDNKTMLNASGIIEKDETKYLTKKRINTIGVISLVVLLYGLYSMSKNVVEVEQ